MSLLKNGLKLSSGALLASVFSFLLSPVLTRIYSPENFGIGESVNIYGALLGLVFTMRLDTAFVVAKEQQQKDDLLSAILINNAVLLCVFTIIFLIFSIITNQYFYLFVPMLAIVTSIYEIGIWILNSHSRFTQSALCKVVLVLGIIVCKIFFGYFYDSLWAILIATLVGKLIATILVGTYIQKKRLIHIAINLNVWKAVMTKYRDLLLNVFPASLLVISRESVANIILLFFQGGRVVGLYILGVKLLKLPVNILGNSISDVLYKRFTEVGKRSAQEKEIYLFFINSSTVVLILFIVANLIAPLVVPKVFGENWAEVSKILLALSPLYYCQFLFATIDKLAIYYHYEKELLRINVVSEVGSLLTLCAGLYFGYPIFISLLAFSLINVIPRVFLIRILYKKKQKFTANTNSHSF